MSFKNQPENDNKNSDQKHEDRNPVDGIHITDPGAGRFVRILFSDIKIFSNLSKYAHLIKVKDK
jgi:hypothetical protein